MPDARRALLGAALLVASPALAHESEPVELQFDDVYDLSGALEWDSGWLPKGSPLTIRLSVLKDGEDEQGVITEMSAISNVSWPEALTLDVAPIAESGWFALLTDLRIGADIQFDVFGYTFFEEELWSYTLRLEDDTVFDPLLLAGGDPELASLSGSGDPVEWDYSASVFTGVDLRVNLDITPVGYATLLGDRLEVALADDPGTPTVMDTSDTRALLPLPADNPGELALLHTWYGRLDAFLALEFRPALDVCVLGACIEVLAFEAGATLAEVGEERAIGPLEAFHPLPALDAPPTLIDFGEVMVGNLANHELPLDDVGALEVFGELVTEGDGAFGVYPDSFFATAELGDGAVVSFAPTSSGTVHGTLVLTSNDPLQERVEIELVGVGVVEDADPDTDPNDPTGDAVVDDDDHIIKTCGCAAPTGAAPGAWIAALGLLAARRRRVTRRG